jgi:ABC-type nitrate/sulfonate/bicarbonate transport system permease component
MAPGPSVKPRRLLRRLLGTGLESAVPAVVVVLWWVTSANSTSLYFPPLSKIIRSFGSIWLSSRFASDAVPSLEHLALGFLAATAVGVLVGFVLGSVPALSEALMPALEALRAVPTLALVPAAVLVLGIGAGTQVAVIASAAVWPILLNTADGVRGVDPAVRDLARSYQIRLGDRMIRLVLRAASPQIVAGMRTALSIAVVMIVFSEMVGSTDGIGYQLLESQRGFDVSGMWAAMILLGALGYLLNIAFRGFERIALNWHHGMRRTHD